MVTFDASMLIWLLDPGATPPTNPGSGQAVPHAKERIEYLVQTLDKEKTPIIIPTPALSEFLVHAGDAASNYIDQIKKTPAFRVVDFDQRAAAEAAVALRSAIDGGDKRDGTGAPWNKVKYDRQIVAISKVEGAKTIYSDDGDIRTYAAKVGIEVVRLADLPLPPEEAQGSLPLEQADHPEQDEPDGST